MECDLLTVSPDQVVDYVTVEGRGGGREGGEGGGWEWKGERGGISVVRSKTDAEDSVLSVNQYCSHVTILTPPTFQMCFTSPRCSPGSGSPLEPCRSPPPA